MPATDKHPPISQPVHTDADFAHPTHPFAYVINIPLTRMTPDNGSTEVWLGTHADSGMHVQEGVHGERASGRITSAVLDKRRTVRPPCQPVVEKGSIVLRDLRLWHAGMGNRTGFVRVMLAMSEISHLDVCFCPANEVVHFAPWYRNPMRLEMSESVKPVVEQEAGLDIPVDWVREQEALRRYLGRGFGNAYDFSQA